MKLWIVSSIFTALAGFCDVIECEFCEKEFTLLGRHRWRCKARVNTDSIDLDQRQVINSYHATRPFENNHDVIGENASIANTNNMVNGNNEELMSSMAWVKRCYSEKSKNLNKLLVFEALYP